MSEEKNLIGKEILTYRIVSLIGRGGMGSVYLAENKHIDQKVAIKVLNPGIADSPVVRAKFAQEARTLLGLDHQNIVRFLNFVENEDGVFLIMEYVDGITLEDFIATKNGLLVEDRALPIFGQILDAFAYAHRQGVVHRDIKPANIILTNDKEGGFIVKVLDFGIASIINESNDDEKGLLVGTPAYMSPEQVRAEKVDERSDIYSLGVLLHQMLTGRTPYDTTTLSETDIHKKVVGEPLPRMKEFFPYVSDRMQKVVDKATAKKPAERYHNCAAFARAIHPKPPVPLWKKLSVVAILLLLIGGGWWLYDFNYVTKVRYYKDYVEQWGVPVGIGKLSGSDAANRTSSYRFEKIKGRVTRLSHVNRYGNLIEHNDSESVERYIDAQLFYTDKGNINYVKCLDRNGKVLYIKDYDEGLRTVSFKHDDEAKTGMTLASSTTAMFAGAFNTSGADARSKISKYLITYDDKGFVTELRYAGFQSPKVPDSEGIYGRRYEVDDKGRVVKETYLGKDYTPKSNKAGLAIKKFEYGAGDDFSKVSYFTPAGKPGFDGNGCHSCVVEHDRYGNRIRERYYDREGNPALRTDCRVAGYDYVVESGLMVSHTAVGIDGKPAYVAHDPTYGENDLYGFCKAVYSYDMNGYRNYVSFYDVDDNKTLNSQGYFTVKVTNDEKGNPEILQYLDTQYDPCESLLGYAKMVSRYDERGNEVEVSFWNTADELCVANDGNAAYKAEYDQLNRLTLVTFLDENYSPVETVYGTITIRQDYDLNGNLVKVSYLDADGESLRNSKEGIAVWEQTFVDGNLTTVEYLDEKGWPAVASGTGFAKWSVKYDDNGNITCEEYFGADSRPLVLEDNSRGVAYSKILKSYDDELGAVVEESMFRNDRRINIMRYAYDDNGLPVEYWLFDGDNRPVKGRNGSHRISNAYNDQGLVSEISYYGVDGRLTLVADDVGKYAMMKSEYDRMGRVTRQTFYGVDEKPTPLTLHVPEGLSGYDERGNMNYVAMGDGAGNLLYDPQSGYAYVERAYDLKGNITEERYFSAKDKLRTTGFPIARYEYDANYRQVACLLFNTQDKPAEFDGWHKYTLEYDEQGSFTYQKYYSLAGTVVGTYKYDKNTGEWTEVRDWRQYWRQSMALCPMQVDYGVEVAAIALTGNGCNLTVRFTGLSKYSMDAGEMANAKEYAAGFAMFKQDAGMPSSAKLTVIGVDKDRRELFRLTY